MHGAQPLEGPLAQQRTVHVGLHPQYFVQVVIHLRADAGLYPPCMRSVPRRDRLRQKRVRLAA
eukprot:1187639-Prorocentrum_minimum.AAC.4